MGEKKCGDCPGKVCVVAGAATGIGRGTVIRLAEEGCKVVAGDFNLEGVTDTANVANAAGKAAGGAVIPAAFDMTDEDSIARLVQIAVDSYGGLDAIFVNAFDARFYQKDTDALSISMDDFDGVLDVGLRGYLVATRKALPELLKRGCGAIVYTSSGAAFLGQDNRPSYSIAKVGLSALARHVARRWGKDKIRANCIAPGVVVTESVRDHMTPELEAWSLGLGVSHRLGTVEDIAAMVAFLLSEDGSWITGQFLSVDGGALMR